MGNVYKQKGSIVLYKEERNGTDYIQIEYANSPTVALLLAYDEDIETTGSGWAYMEAASFVRFCINRILFPLISSPLCSKLIL